MRAMLLKTLAPLAAHRGMSALERLRVLWPLLASTALANVSRPDRIDEQRRLVVVVASPGVAQELQLTSGQLLGRINTHRDLLDTPRLASVLTRVAAAGTFPTPAPAPVRAPQAAHPIAPRIQSALSDVRDPSLKAQLRRLAGHAPEQPDPDAD